MKNWFEGQNFCVSCEVWFPVFSSAVLFRASIFYSMCCNLFINKEIHQVVIYLGVGDSEIFQQYILVFERQCLRDVGNVLFFMSLRNSHAKQGCPLLALESLGIGKHKGWDGMGTYATHPFILIYLGIDSVENYSSDMNFCTSSVWTCEKWFEILLKSNSIFEK